MFEPASTSIVRLALVTSLAIALATFTAAAWTGSSTMLAAAIQALAATSSQVLMLVGISRAQAPEHNSASRRHDGDIHFWSYAAGVLLFSMGAGVAIYEGADRLVKPQRIAEIEMAYWLTAFAAAAQSYALWRAVRASPKPADGQGLVAALRALPDAPLLAVLAEGVAGLAGLALALAGVALVHFSGATWIDGAASLSIGLVLAAVATFMSLEVRALLSRAGNQIAAAAAEPAAISTPAVNDAAAQELPTPPPLLVAEAAAPATAPAAIAHKEHASGRHRGKKKGRHRHR